MTTPCPPRALRITVVESSGCHFCDDAHRVLAELVEHGHQVEVTTIEARSAEGQALMQRHRAGLSPLVLADGVFFSQGRLPRRKFSRLLEQRRPAPAPGAPLRP